MRVQLFSHVQLQSCLLEMDEENTEDKLSVYTEENSETNVVIFKNR